MDMLASLTMAAARAVDIPSQPPHAFVTMPASPTTLERRLKRGGATTQSSVNTDEDKQKRRRAQIAEASRKSRARRKELIDSMKKENDVLHAKIVELSTKLKLLGHDAGPLPGRTASSPEDSGDDEASGPQHETDQASVNTSPAGSSAVVAEWHVPPAATTPAGQQQQQQQQESDVASFLEARLQFYFSLLKGDMLKLNFSAQDRALIASAQARVVCQPR